MVQTTKSGFAVSEEAYADNENTTYALRQLARLDRPASKAAPTIKGPDSTRHSVPSAVEEEGGHATGHNNNHTDAAPLLPFGGEADLEAAWHRMLKAALKHGFKQLGVGLVLLILECAVLALLGLAINNLGGVKAIPDSVPISVLLMIIAVFAEVMLVSLAIPILYCCFSRSILPYTLGVLAVVAAGFSIYMLSIVGFHNSHGTCDGDKYKVACSRALSMAIGAGCIRLLVSAPIYMGIAVAYYMVRRGGAPPTGLWMRFVYGVGELFMVDN